MFGEDMVERAKEEFESLRGLCEKTLGEKMLEKILKNYIEQDLKNVGNISLIHRLFEKALREKDTQWIIKAYTAESDFFTKFSTRRSPVELDDGRVNGGTSSRCFVFTRNWTNSFIGANRIAPF